MLIKIQFLPVTLPLSSVQFRYLWEMPKKQHLEFIVLMAALMSSVALALDALLPALDLIGMAVGNTDPTRNQWLITLFFLGAGSGPLLFGPLSDSVGRKPLVYFGFALFALASWVCVSSQDLTWMVTGRFLQGVALSGPRTISIAMIRDKFSGDFMARIMSFVTVVFILVPVIAPTLGKAILDAYGWRAIFYFQVGFGVLVAIWFWIRQPETLPKSKRNTFRPVVLLRGFREVLQYRRTVIYTGIWGLITGSFLVYLSTSQVIFEIQYGAEALFPYLFAALAITIGTATFLNGSLVLRLPAILCHRVPLWQSEGHGYGTFGPYCRPRSGHHRLSGYSPFRGTEYLDWQFCP